MTEDVVVLDKKPSEDDLRIQELMRLSFRDLARLVKRDLNENETTMYTFSRSFNRDDVQRWITNPQKYEKQLRQVVRFLFFASSHFRRAVLYFATLPLFKYTVEMYGADFKTLDTDVVRKKYIDTVNF